MAFNRFLMFVHLIKASAVLQNRLKGEAIQIQSLYV
jgi:hypothetical protein